VAGGEIRNFTLAPESFGLARHSRDDLRGGDPDYNADALRALLAGAAGAYRDTVLMNAGAGLVVAGIVRRLEDGIRKAAEAIDSGGARKVLEDLVRVSNE